jgi:hypothetical protein
MMLLPMKCFVLCLALFASMAAWAQFPRGIALPLRPAKPGTEPDSLFMTPAQNSRWLGALKTQQKATQWARVRSRYFESPQWSSSPLGEAGSLPVLVVDGIVVGQTSAGKPIRDLLATQLTADKVKDILVMERQPDELYIEKAFTGLIVISLADRPLRKALRHAEKHALQPGRAVL